MRDLVESKGAGYVSVYDAVCGNSVCDEFARDNVPLQFDAGHLTAAGSLKIGARLAREPRARLAVSLSSGPEGGLVFRNLS